MNPPVTSNIRFQITAMTVAETAYGMKYMERNKERNFAGSAFNNKANPSPTMTKNGTENTTNFKVAFIPMKNKSFSWVPFVNMFR